MTERSRFWDGTAVGDATAAPYDAATEFAAVLRSLTSAGIILPDASGVFAGDGAELLVAGASSPLNYGTGHALCYGTWYENDVSDQIVVPTPAAATRIDAIVLRKSWASQTVRVTRVAGVEGGGAPALTQVAGVTWDEPLAQASITTLGAITVTDTRAYLGGRVHLDRRVSATTFTNDAAENEIYRRTIAVAEFSPVGRIRVRVFFRTTNTVGAGSQNITFRVKLGATTMSTIVPSFANGVTAVTGWIDCVIQARGVAAQTAIGRWAPINSSYNPEGLQQNQQAVNTAIANDLVVTLQQQTASGNLSTTVDFLDVEKE